MVLWIKDDVSKTIKIYWMSLTIKFYFIFKKDLHFILFIVDLVEKLNLDLV